jgi:hypothetical protein
MFSFEEQYKKFEQLNERTKQAYEFWLETVTSTCLNLRRSNLTGGITPLFCFSKYTKCVIYCTNLVRKLRSYMYTFCVFLYI